MDAHIPDLNRDHDRTEKWCEAQEEAIRRMNEGDVTCKHIMAGAREYWANLGLALQEKNKENVYRFLEQGVLDVLTREKLDHD